MIDREHTIAGLRELADFLEANSDVPVSQAYHSKTITFHVLGVDEDAKRDEVDRAAVALGVEPYDSGDGHYSVMRRFSGGVEYQVAAVTDACMAEYDALMSYDGAVQTAGGAA